MPMSATRLRANLYRILDRVSRTGVPVEIEHKGRRVKIIPGEPTKKLSRLKAHPDFLKVDAESIVHMDWSREWKP
jgi:prevent-host-death family protein